MSAETSPAGKLRVVVVGGGVAALESVLALADLAPDRTDVTMLAPNEEFVYRPMTVREPFAYGSAHRYPLEPIVRKAGATLLRGELQWVDPDERTIHTKGGESIEYDALMLALGAKINARYAHALTIDDRHMDETLHGLIQDVEGGYLRSLAFVSPGRMPWPLPLYELAMMTAGRAYDMNIDLSVTIVTPEDAPLAIFGAAVSSAVGERLAKLGIQTMTSAYAEIPSQGQIVINPGARRLQVDRAVALPELYGPSVRGIPLGEHGFIRVDRRCQVPDLGPVYAAGDATEFAIKQGGIAAQQADTAAQAIAALAGASVTPEPFQPVMRGILLTDAEPLYIKAQITGGKGFSSEISDTPTWSPPSKIAARYLAPCLEEYDRRSTDRQTA